MFYSERMSDRERLQAYEDLLQGMMDSYPNGAALLIADLIENRRQQASDPQPVLCNPVAPMAPRPLLDLLRIMASHVSPVSAGSRLWVMMRDNMRRFASATASSTWSAGR